MESCGSDAGIGRSGGPMGHSLPEYDACLGLRCPPTAGRIRDVDTPGLGHTTAGVLLVREAGGRVTDVSGKDWVLGSGGVIASALDETHEELFRLLDGSGHRT